MDTVAAMARAVREREVSPVELAGEILGRIEAWQPITNAFSQIRPEVTLAEARARADAIVRERSLGPLHGVPVAIKDLFDVAGWETTGCCAAYRGRVADGDAPVVRRLREAGVVLAGKTNQHELAAGATNLISSCGPTRNPWDPERITGGSSGGSGAAVAAGTVPLALGTDTGGSIRIPASLCGVTGLKPTYGRVPLDGVMPLAPSMDTVGPMATTVQDATVAFALLAGEDRAFVDRCTGPLEGMTVGVLGGVFAEAARPDVLEAREAMAGILEGAGAEATAVLGDVPSDLEVWEMVAWPEFFDHHGALLDRAEGIDPWTRELLERGRDFSEEARREGVRASAQVRAALLAMLEVADLLLAPATAFPSPLADQREVEIGDGRVLDVRRGAISLLTRPVNLAGLPALSLPAGFSEDGLPLGVQLIGRFGEEEVLLRAGHAVQERTEHHLRRPGPTP